jgi:hypothetical protein
VRTDSGGNKINLFATTDSTWLGAANTAVNPE